MAEKMESYNEKNIIFIGFMGVGKTTVGQIVAEKLSRPFIDIDNEIEKAFNKSIPDIFAEDGEAAFREKERELMRQHCLDRLKVISIGGGAFQNEEIRKICMDHAIVIFLDISWESWRERMDSLVDTRPVLQNSTDDEIKDLFYRRKAVYAEHHLRIDSDEQSSEEIADYVTKELKHNKSLRN
ncbi:shikimate kinase [Salisediminibacterium halotolerans]|uniref:Shikimate kinase n=1 Tax=Salisediminibacterium halotolerans TaxID=517425 RepID=A0A1H9S169_9BACI|nr:MULTISPECIES: shikimate kinase [Salisediminibacterium]RLJ78210.1 shikimate kinase [Actinophytocola xinjiangensis]RPE88451.1 shikimate kinase [Salisediminibacterium halotolerans]TWG37187.1 shikimate kinase [Salisediminibacterium halotolerans]SER78668.1 shikimate kinase [Salisediminibacterium haloalkalitolerans]GEL07121.1 shikimate kinase [Salisediminibacterium halotolerans]